MQLKQEIQNSTDTEFYAVDLTATVQGPIFGRDEEIDRMIEILSRKHKNHPILVGDAGVGKTSVVQGLAYRIARGEVPERLQGRRVLSLDIALLASDLKSIAPLFSSFIKEKAILFIDEIHNIVGAGKAHGSLDLSNILKPLLTDGSLTCIGATTDAEYLKYFAKDNALDRRFTKITILEPSSKATIEMLSHIKKGFEDHHGVTIDSDAINASVDLSVKYLKQKRLPDKAIDLLDESCSKVSIQSSRIKFLEKQLEDAKSKGDFETASKILYNDIPKCEVVSRVVTRDIVTQVLSERTGIPVNKMTSDDKKRLLNIESFLKKRVIGQDHVLEVIADSIRSTRTGLKHSVSSFIFLGSSGVGKTETAKALAEFLFDSKDSFIVFNMSEFQEKQSVSNLIGAPAGYVGYEEGGRLTNAVQNTPNCVILLDEIEKAHNDVFDILLQVLDEGTLTDNKGVTVDMKNAVIIMTSNLNEKELRDRYRNEFIGRVDSILTFNSLSKSLVKKITRKKLEDLSEKVKAGNNFTVVVDDCLFDFIVDNSLSAEYGAREIDNLIAQYVMKPLSRAILNDEIDGDTDILRG